MPPMWPPCPEQAGMRTPRLGPADIWRRMGPLGAQGAGEQLPQESPRLQAASSPGWQQRAKQASHYKHPASTALPQGGVFPSWMQLYLFNSICIFNSSPWMVPLQTQTPLLGFSWDPRASYTLAFNVVISRFHPHSSGSPNLAVAMNSLYEPSPASSNRETEAQETAQEAVAGKGAAMPQKGDMRKLGHQGWHRRVEMGQEDHRMGRFGMVWDHGVKMECLGWDRKI